MHKVDFIADDLAPERKALAGLATALRAKALGMDVAFHDPYRQDGVDKTLGIRRVESLETLFREAFVLSLHCPLNDETRHRINAKSLEWLPKGAYLVNTARGGLIDMRVKSTGACRRAVLGQLVRNVVN